MTLPSLILVVAFPFLVSIVTSAALWRWLERKWLFLIISLLSIAAVADTSLSIFQAALVPAMPDPLPSDLLNFNIEVARRNRTAMLLADAVVLIVGLPLLGWLFAALRKPTKHHACGLAAVS